MQGVWPLSWAPFLFGSMGMNKARRAYYVPDPRRWEDLITTHLAVDERPYEIVKTVTLGAIDYGNFITGILADRSFIEENHALRGKGNVWRCLLVRKRGTKDGILVMPEDEAYVSWTEYVSEIGPYSESFMYNLG